MNFNSVEEYIHNFPVETQGILLKFRNLIFNLSSEVEEGISYGMPGYKLHGQPLVYFAGYKKHIGFYATPTGHEKFSEKLSLYKQGKGSVQFPLDKPMPWELIEEIILFRIEENVEKHKK